MSQIKEYAEQVSEEMGFGGELTDEVLTEAQRRLDVVPMETTHTTIDTAGGKFSVFHYRSWADDHWDDERLAAYFGENAGKAPWFFQPSGYDEERYSDGYTTQEAANEACHAFASEEHAAGR